MNCAQSASPLRWKCSKNIYDWPNCREFMTSHVICEQREKLESVMKQKELEIWSLGQKIARLEEENAKAVHNSYHLWQTIAHHEVERTFMYNKELINALEIDQLREKVRQLETEIQKCANVAKENEKLLRRQNDEHRLNYENQHMQDEMRNLLVKIKLLKEENDTATSVSKTYYENDKLFITKERNQLQETINLLRNENKNLQEDLAALSIDRRTTSDHEVERLQMELQHNQSEMQLLKERMIEKESNNAKLKKDIHIRMEEKENLIKIKKQLQDDLISQNEKMGVLEQEISHFKEWNKLTDTEKELSQLRDNVRDMEHKMLRQKRNRANDKEPNHLQTKVKHMEEEMSRLTEKLSRSDNVEKELLAKINEMNEEKAQQLTRSKIIEEECDRLQAQVQNIEEERARLEQQLNRSHDTQIEIYELLAKVKKMEEEKAKVERQLSKSYDTERQLNELRIKVKNTEEEKSNLAQQLNKLNDTKKEFDQLHAKIQRIEDENSRLKRQLTNLDNLNEELNEKSSEIKVLTESNEKLTVEYRQLQYAHSAISKERDEIATRISSAEENLGEYMKAVRDKNDDIQQLQTEVNDLKRNSNVTKNELLSVKGQMDRLQENVNQLSEENSNLHKENIEVTRQKEDALQRLSRLAGAKLTHGNAAITDLSDTDRPTKIAEKFSELYDNAWTDAFEELDTTYHNETESINVLLNILQEAYTFCVQAEKDYEDKINRAVLTLAQREILSADVAVQKALVDLRISLRNPCCSVIEEMFSSRLPSILRDLDVAVCPKTKTFARECASLSWRMRIREPPVFVGFEFRKGTSFNQEILRKFTTTGGYIDFLVWPALYLHENGPLLAKGVAQAKLTP